MSERVSWERFKSRFFMSEAVGVSVDLSRMSVADSFFAAHDAAMRKALAAMDALEAGAIANPDEQRMVGHYWLRDARRAPTPEIAGELPAAGAAITRVARHVHAGRLAPPRAKAFRNLLVVGIGGSALGPQFVARALGDVRADRLRPFFLDNTDPDGIDAVLARLDGDVRETLAVVISK